MSVPSALQMINRFLAEDEFDADTQFCLRWFEQHHWNQGSLAKQMCWPVPKERASKA